MSLYGTISYPGINLYESFDFTDLVGITPAVATITVLLPDGGAAFPAANGPLTIYSDGNPVVTLNYMHLDSVAFHQDGGGKVATIRLLDERWAWAFCYVTGHYNQLLPDGTVDPAHEKTPQWLAASCFIAIGVDSYDVSQLPNDARPEVDWDSANAAQELEKLIDSLGCRLVCQRSTGQWVVVITGLGNSLPDDIPYENPGAGISPKPTPDFLRIVTGPFRFQVCFPLIAAGRDLTHAWKDLQDVSYKPTQPSGFPKSYCAEFGFDWWYQSRCSWVRTVQPDGTAKSPREFALESAFKQWRIINTKLSSGPFAGQPGMYIPGYGANASRKQIIVTNELVESYTDELGVLHHRPSYIFGSFACVSGSGQASVGPPNAFGTVGAGNYPVGTRIDYQGINFSVDPEEPGSFSVNIDPIDTDRTIITTSKPMMTFYQNTTSTPNNSSYGAAVLYFTCAVNIRDPNTWVPVRYEKYLQIGNGANKGFCQTIIQDDIEPWTIQTYDYNGNPQGNVNFTRDMPGSSTTITSGYGFTGQGGSGNRNNYAEVNQMCDYYLNSYAQKFQIVATATRTYFGFQQIDMNGAICQVQWTCNSRGGASTIASVGTEHNYRIPTYEQRLQRNSTHSAADKRQYDEYRSIRRSKLAGSSNTI